MITYPVEWIVLLLSEGLNIDLEEKLSKGLDEQRTWLLKRTPISLFASTQSDSEEKTDKYKVAGVVNLVVFRLANV